VPFVEISGTKLYYEETGSGDPIVFLHEFGADYRTWEAQVRRFSRDYRCITYNARGYPPSDVPEAGTAYTFEHVIAATGGGSGIGTAMCRRLTREGTRGCHA
jgi:pimeloyl-ACP methyl ester carboxylesterase